MKAVLSKSVVENIHLCYKNKVSHYRETLAGSSLYLMNPENTVPTPNQ